MQIFEEFVWSSIASLDFEKNIFEYLFISQNNHVFASSVETFMPTNIACGTNVPILSGMSSNSMKDSVVAGDL